MGDVEVCAHPLLVYDQAADDADRERLHVVEQDRRVGQDHALGAGVADVALVPQRDVLDRRLRVAAQHSRQPGDALGRDRVALVRHRARPLLGPRAKRLLGLADLRALKVADLRRQPLQARPGERDRLQQLGVAVTRDDLRRDVLGAEPEPREHAALEVRRRRGVGADGAAERADADARERSAQPFEVAMRLEREACELDPEGRRLGVDAVRAARADRADMRAGLRHERRDDLLGAADHDLAG